MYKGVRIVINRVQQNREKMKANFDFIMKSIKLLMFLKNFIDIDEGCNPSEERKHRNGERDSCREEK